MKTATACTHQPQFSRRTMLAGLAAFLCVPRAHGDRSDELPREVAGIGLPRTPLAAAAARFARRSCPPFLFNHCVRTYLFGAIAMEHHGRTYNAEDAFVASCLHDLGLLKAFASPAGSFEVDGANFASDFARRQGAPARDAETIWHAVALHDARFALVEHADTAAMLVAMGAGTDVLGPDEGMVDAKRMQQVLAAFPRLAFKKNFTALLGDHCRRKPLSQRGTWLEGECRKISPGAWADDLDKDIAAAPFAE